MKPFRTIRKNLALIGIMPKQFHYRWYPFSRQCLIVNLINLIGLISTTMFTIRANSIQEYMDSFYVQMMGNNILISYTTVVLNMKKWFCFCENCEKLLDSICRESRSQRKPILLKTNQMIEMLSKVLYFGMLIMGTSVVVLPKAIVSFYNHFTTSIYSENDVFELSLPVWIPFNWENPFGYLCAVVCQCVMTSFLLHYLACFISLAFSAYLFVTLFNDFMIDDLKLINKMTTTKNKKTKSERYKKFKSDSIFDRLSAFIRIYGEIKEISINFSELYETTLTVLFCGCTISLSVTMVMIKIGISNNQIDFLMLWKSIFYGVGVFGLAFFSCELGQRFSNSFDDIDEFMIGKLKWYLLPIKVQRLLPVITLNVQQPVVIKCFGNVLCGREQFKKVINTAYQYFMVLRKFY